MGRWEHFKDTEVVGLKDDVVRRLDNARDLYGKPIVITSGFRDPARNAEVGGVDRSAHCTGLAVDIRCSDPNDQFKLAWALGRAGFRRIGRYERHVHADCDADKPQDVVWFGSYRGHVTGREG